MITLIDSCIVIDEQAKKSVYFLERKNAFHLPRQEINKRLEMLILWYIWKPRKEFY